jgi:hypothetical protein
VAIETARKPFIGVPTWAVLLKDGEVVMISLRISKKLSNPSIQTTSPSSLIAFRVASSRPRTKALAWSIVEVSHMR